ncbi:MAG: fold metallo-hydrolase [Moraxellaceae bacterium]|jgi:L-ascorbate metabolism protein UlaG (beta-lactamase superfamily)|nr:fold metallo-hydrolase [Moraxellaceae bacterium]
MALWKRMIGLRQANPEWFCSHEGCNHLGAADTVSITYLGTAGFVIKGAGRTLVLDPYVSRPGVVDTLARPLVPDTALIRATIPEADDVLIGHAHYDHILDAPDLCRQTGARLIGSDSTIQVGRAAGLPESQLRATAGREDIASGSWTVRGLPSRHGRVFGRIPFPGDITAPPPWPPRMADLRHGLVLNWIVDTGGLRIAHIDSADFINEELAGQQVDVVCLCAIGRQARPDFVKDVVRLLKPRWIIPCHWDTMLTPLHEEPDLIPGVDLPGLLNEILAAGCEPLLTPMLGVQRFPARLELCPL